MKEACRKKALLIKALSIKIDFLSSTSQALFYTIQLNKRIQGVYTGGEKEGASSKRNSEKLCAIKGMHEIGV